MISKNIAVVLVASTLFLGCGGGGTSSNTSDVLTGVFADEPVYGLRYKTATQEGYTDENGAFKYKAGEDVEFFLNTLSLGKVKADEFITPYILSGDIDIDNPSVKTTNIALLLQNFDANRLDTKNIDVTKFKDLGQYDLSYINLNSSISLIENEISALLSTGGFQQYIDETNTSLVDNSTAITKMQNYINKVRMFEGSYKVYGITDYVDNYQFTSEPVLLGTFYEAGLKNFDVSGYNGFYIEINDPDYKIDLLNLDGQNIYTTSSFAISTSNVNMATDDAHFLEEFATANDGKYATLSFERTSSDNAFIMLTTHGKKTLSIKMIKINDNVTDTTYNLQWQDSVDNLSNDIALRRQNSKSWANAKSYCDELVYLGKSDWKLPTLAQMRTTIDMTQASKIKYAFSNIADFGDDTYWVSDNSSSPYMAFSYGTNRDDYDPQTMTTLLEDDGSGAYVRCVRTTTNNTPTGQNLTIDSSYDRTYSINLANYIDDVNKDALTLIYEGSGVLSGDIIIDNTQTGITGTTATITVSNGSGHGYIDYKVSDGVNTSQTYRITINHLDGV